MIKLIKSLFILTCGLLGVYLSILRYYLRLCINSLKMFAFALTIITLFKFINPRRNLIHIYNHN